MKIVRGSPSAESPSAIENSSLLLIVYLREEEVRGDAGLRSKQKRRGRYNSVPAVKKKEELLGCRYSAAKQKRRGEGRCNRDL